MSEKTALVWGAAGGIGRAVTQRLTADGWQVVAFSHHPDELDGISAHTLEVNVADPFSVQRAVTAASQEAGEASLFVYTAGDIVSEPVGKTTPDVWLRILDANLTGAFLTVHYSLPLLTADAPLVFLGAVSERLRLPGLSAYVAAKAGLEAFTEALRKEERKRRVILVRPGAVDTAFWQKVPFRMPASALSAEQTAQQIVSAVHGGHNGVLDL